MSEALAACSAEAQARDRAELASAVRELVERGVPVEQAREILDKPWRERAQWFSRFEQALRSAVLKVAAGRPPALQAEFATYAWRAFERWPVFAGEDALLDSKGIEPAVREFWDVFVRLRQLHSDDLPGKPDAPINKEPKNGDPDEQSGRSPPADGAFVGHKTSLRLHHVHCQWAQKMALAERVPFKDPKEALGKGYRWCKECGRGR